MTIRVALILGLLVVTVQSATTQRAPGDATPSEYTVAFASFGPLNTDIFVASGDGAAAVPFLPHPGLDYNASISSDGEWVVFTSERNGSTDIYRARRDSSDLQRLTDHSAFDDQASLSGNGRYVAFVSSRSGNADVWILDLQSGSLRNLTNHSGGDFRPAWSPDGAWIAFSSDRDVEALRIGFVSRRATEIYVIRVDGTGCEGARMNVGPREHRLGRVTEGRSSTTKERPTKSLG